mmetsp:Transcript_68444/g.198489  ORF Transcript_68444/g.198489 Transcript_68444/m.198489 type:complete len:196 (+) Transcript_68444:101-688(+)
MFAAFNCCAAHNDDPIEIVDGLEALEAWDQSASASLDEDVAGSPMLLNTDEVTIFESSADDSVQQRMSEAGSNPDMSLDNPDVSCNNPGFEFNGEGCKGEALKRERIRRLRCFMAAAGFKGVNTPRVSGVLGMGRSATYPLHAAVRANNPDIVAMLLWAGADRSRRDSGKLSPHELAKRLARGDSHSKVIELLEA